MQLDPGVLGATAQSWDDGPRELLKRVVEANSGSDRPGLLAAYREALDDLGAEDRDALLATMIAYWFDNNYRRLIDGSAPSYQRSRAVANVAIATAAEHIRGRITKKIQEAASIVLMDMVLPNGKPLRDCTGVECRALAPRIGAWLASVGKRVGARQIVGASLTEEKLQALYSEAGD